MSQQPSVTFDEFSKIRILDPAQFEASEKLKEECREFTQKTDDFNNIVQAFLDMMDDKAKQIEEEKLKACIAIGLRNRVESQAEHRKSTQMQLQTLIKERQAELDRLTQQAESLAKVQQEQQTLIDNLSSK
ncbi:Intraflagellar transport protein 20 [Rhizophlyctis rosea]|uniref:Intraflagellar transport protein 20 n=1 Tax=Rhizophlyctis rosea TaxID=64517 RepID=A0AAD5X4D8_9FUNG|nr:Intraflagellar transport protein 20 [Rhizophlyctis rosea]